MKLRCEEQKDGIRVLISGSIDGSKCNCLENFWDFHVGTGHTNVEIDMAEVDDVDPLGLATTVTLIRRHLDEGAAVVLSAPPQMVAHTLYKAALMESEQLRIEAAREEEPYAG